MKNMNRRDAETQSLGLLNRVVAILLLLTGLLDLAVLCKRCFPLRLRASAVPMILCD